MQSSESVWTRLFVLEGVRGPHAGCLPRYSMEDLAMLQRILVVCLMLLCIASCAPAAQPFKPVEVVATIAPLADWAQKVGGERVHVRLIVPIGYDPIQYEPAPVQRHALRSADLVLMNGLGLEPWIEDIFEDSTGNKPVILDVSQFVGPLTNRPLSDNAPQGPDERTAAQRQQSETVYAAQQASRILSGRYMWLDPDLAQAQVGLVADMLIRVDPNGIALYRQNAARYMGELQNLDIFIRSEIKQWRWQTLVGADLFLFPFASHYKLPLFAVDDLHKRRLLAKGQPIFVDVLSTGAGGYTPPHGHSAIKIDPLPSLSYITLMKTVVGLLGSTMP